MTTKQKLQLTTDQQSVIKGICEDLQEPDTHICLCGYAGTGKTVTTAALVSRLQESNLKVIVATPTHKARSQVEKALRNQGADGFECVTVHRLLGLRQVRNYSTGIESFEPDPSGNNMLYYAQNGSRQFDIIIVDEVSMLQHELYELLKFEADGRPIVFVGDDRQLLPVKEEKACAAFVESDSIYKLVDVLRHDGAILNLATATRQMPIGRARFEDAVGGGSRVCAYRNRSNWKENLLEMMISDDALKNPDYCRALAWTNNAVRDLNAEIHIARYGKNAPQYVEGMTCVTSDAIPDPNVRGIIYNSTVDLFIREAEIQMFRAPFDGPADELWKTWVLTVIATDAQHAKQIRVIHGDDEKRWKESQKEFADCAKAEPDKEKRKPLWAMYFARKDQFGRIQPASALTVHKSQGSTFENVFLHWSIDGFGSQPTSQQNQLAYVGITRASQTLHVIRDY